jgi:tetratricopeptide (TPR) repeat protein
MLNFRFGKLYLAFILICFTSLASASIVKDSDKLIKLSKFVQAYQLLTEKGVELKHSGNHKYNYNLGVTALRTGKYSHAIFALKRVLYAKPQHVGAQLDLAIAYYHVGNLVFAEKELKRIKKLYAENATTRVKNTIDKYLQKIVEKNTKLHLSASFVFSVGETSNMNSGIEADSIDTVLGAVTISEASRKTPSDFVSLNGSVKASYDIKRDLTFDTKIASSAIHYRANPDLNQISSTMSFGIKKKQADLNFYANTSFSRASLNNKEHLTTDILSVTVSQSPSKSISNVLSVSRNHVRFINAIDQIGDINKTVLNLAHSRVIPKLNITLSTKLSKGKVKSLNGRPDGDENFAGIKMTARKVVGKGIATLSLGKEKHEYDQVNAMYGVIREDTIKTASLNYKLPFAKGKAVNIGVSYSDQQSNIATNTKDKLTPSVGLVISF